MSGTLKPLARLPAEARRRIKVVLCDIDDTLTTEGRLPAASYSSLERLQRAGLLVLPITGRPAGWCDHMARMWPIDGIVGENGAFYFRYDRDAKRMVRVYWLSAERRAADRERLAELEARILREVPGSAVASDQRYREADLAIDYCEDVPPLSADRVARIVAIFEAAGARAKVSSIHVNGWFGDYDKLTTTRLLMQECFGVDLAATQSDFVFVGDSPNDCPMFAQFAHAVGVANIRDFEGRLANPPAYVARQHGGAGFSEVADCILAARG